MVFIKAKVNPSQCTADQAHEAWIIARSSSLIVSLAWQGKLSLFFQESTHDVRSIVLSL